MRLAWTLVALAAAPALAVAGLATALPRYLDPPVSGDAAPAVLAAAAVGLAVAGAWPVARGLERRLDRLAEACQEVARGGRPEPLAEGRRDEVEGVARTFDRMVKALGASADRMAEVLRGDQLVLDVLSHDVKNQVAAVLPRVEMVAIDRPEVAAELAKASGPLERAITIMDDAMLLLRLQGDEAPPPLRADLAELTRQAVASQAPRAEERRVALLYRAPVSPVGLASPLVGRAIENLVANAVKFSAPGSEVEVTVQPAIRNTRVAVVDHGPGIPAAERRELFRRFRRLGQGGPQGHGLGLAIAKRIVEREGGRIWVDDTPGGGATFQLELPAPGSAGPPPPAPLAFREPPMQVPVARRR